MSGVGVLVILLLISSIPAIAVFIWFRLAHYPFSLPRFSFALLTGAASFFPALFLQNFLAAGSKMVHITDKWRLIVEIFIRIALTEELSRFIMLIILFLVIRRLSIIKQIEEPAPGTVISDLSMASTTGLVAGFGFAIIESAVFGVSNPHNILLRIFTSAPLHGACGFRVGSAIAMSRKSPIQAFFRFFSAVAIHGAYNFMLEIPGLFPSIFAVLIALFALTSCILTIHTDMKNPT